MAHQRLDLVVFGATGFTGKYAVAQVHAVAKRDKSLTWGVAGRSQSKLDQVLQELAKKTGDDLSKVRVIIADVSDLDSIRQMTQQANVIVNCCGPYRFYGEPVVKSCVETKTHHVDVSGEPAFMEKMQLQYHQEAEKAGVYIVSACGFDSIPSDVGVIYLEKQFKGQVNTAEAFLTSSTTRPVKVGSAGIHYGTWESLIYGITSMKELGPLRRQLFPTRMPNLIPKIKKRFVMHKSEAMNQWCLPFPGSDGPCVYRSQRYLYETEKKRPVQMKAYVAFSSFWAALGVLSAVAMIALLAMCSFTRKLLLKHPKFFTLGFVSHEGPTEEDAAGTRFSMTVCGEGWDESDKDIQQKPPTKKMKIRVSGMNPGYGATCTFLIFSALAILKESDKMPGRGGVLAPGAAFRNTSLIENLQKNDIEFTVLKE